MKKKILFTSFTILFIFVLSFPVYLRAQYKEYYKDIYKEQSKDDENYKTQDYGDVVYSENDIKSLTKRMKKLEATIEELESSMQQLQQTT